MIFAYKFYLLNIIYIFNPKCLNDKIKLVLKNCLLVFCLLLCVCSCGNNKTYKVEGKLTNLQDQLVHIVYEGSGDRVMDSITCTSPGKFKFELDQEGFNFATLYFEDRTKYITVFLEPKQKVVITGDITYPQLVQVKGGRINDKLTDFYKKNAALIKDQIDWAKAMAEANDVSGSSDILSKLTNVRHQIEESALAYICDHPKEAASAVLIQTYFITPDDTRKLDELLAVLSPELNDFFLVKEMAEYSTRAKRTALGAEAPDFSVKNIYGKPFALDSLKSTYKILAFIAPWCEMCQTDILHLDKVATNYKEDKLEILLVSLDDDPNEVRDFLKQDSIKWNVVTDSANQAAMLFDLYNVSALPRCFLIDEEDKIILKTDNGAEITQILGNLLGTE